jgi:hypothetical protein
MAPHPGEILAVARHYALVAAENDILAVGQIGGNGPVERAGRNHSTVVNAQLIMHDAVVARAAQRAQLQAFVDQQFQLLADPGGINMGFVDQHAHGQAALLGVHQGLRHAGQCEAVEGHFHGFFGAAYGALQQGLYVGLAGEGEVGDLQGYEGAGGQLGRGHGRRLRGAVEREEGDGLRAGINQRQGQQQDIEATLDVFAHLYNYRLNRQQARGPIDPDQNRP